jgi:4'-phosphopantetheinyl transferase
MLNDDEQEKAGRFYREADRHASIVSRGALRVLLAGYGGMKAEKIRFRYSQNGKPYVPDSGITFNVSHSGEWIVLGIGRNRRIGVDIEAVRRETDVLAIATRYFLPEEVALISDAEDSCAVFFRLWARKEAYVKACGSALFRELSAFQVSLEEGERDGWFFHDLEAGSRHAAAVVTDRPVLQLPCYDFGGLRWEN